MLLRTTMDVCQVNYLLQTVPATATKRGAQRYDEYMYDALNRFVGGTLGTDTFHELQLLSRPHDSKTHNFDLGLLSAVCTAPAA